MKKKMSYLILYFTLIGLVFSGCPNPVSYNTHPANQPGTTWATKDKTIIFYVDDNLTEADYGSIQNGEDRTEIAFVISPLVTFVEIALADDMKNLKEGHVIPSFACGQGTVSSNNKYVIEITSADCIFEVGQRLIFYKVDNSLS